MFLANRRTLSDFQCNHSSSSAVCRLSRGKSLRSLMESVKEKAEQMQQQAPQLNALKAWIWLLSMKTLLKLAQVWFLLHK